MTELLLMFITLPMLSYSLRLPQNTLISVRSQAYFRNERLLRPTARGLRLRLPKRLCPINTGQSRAAVNERALSLSLDHGRSTRVALFLPWEFNAGDNRISHALAHTVPWALENLTTVFGAHIYTIMSLPLSPNHCVTDSSPCSAGLGVPCLALRF